MDLGAFSISLAVKDLNVSQAFYAKLGFDPVGGAADEGWLILRNGTTTLGLFQGMFEGNLLTFNPGWNADGSEAEQFEDIRRLQTRLRNAGVAFESEATGDIGPANFVLHDPDGNVILVDQHV